MQNNQQGETRSDSNFNYPPMPPELQQWNVQQLHSLPPSVNEFPFGLNAQIINDDQTNSHYSVYVYCPSCAQYISTSVVHSCNCCTILSSLCCIVSGLFCGCCLIPCCIDSTKEVSHYCPKCNFLIASKPYLFA